MRRGFKVAAWAALFLGCAGVGAFVAAHSNPFPPGVDRPSAPSSVTSLPGSPTPTPPDRWVGSLRSFTYHQLYVGGRCTTRWRGRMRFTVADDGTVEGTGSAHLVGKLVCDFPIAQVQAEHVGLTVGGRLRDGRLTLELSQASVDPSNARDYGGFVPFLPARVALPVHADVAEERITRRKVDEEGRGVYFWSTGFQVGQVAI